MYCSVKFLSPRVTAGLPLPGNDADVVELELDDESLLPPAASAVVRIMAVTTARHLDLIAFDAPSLNNQRSMAVGNGPAAGATRSPRRPLGVTARCSPASASSANRASSATAIAPATTPSVP